MIRTIVLLTASNFFMTFAWYGNLKNTAMPIWKAILISWGIAFFEYCLMVPANRLGYVSGVFAVYYLKEPFHWKYLVSFCFLLGAVYFMFKK
jgi:hypothetical protein